MSFNPGDKVLVNGGLVATVVVYDTDSNQLVYETPRPHGASNTTYAHISNTNLSLIEAVDAEPAQHEAPELPLDGEGE